MRVITLTTDFGVTDEYVGVMKGAILTVNPHVQIVDISHGINPFDRISAARMVRASYRYFPEATVHVIVVDPGVGSDRDIVAFDRDGQFFLAPDNGIPAFLLQDRPADRIVRIDPDGLGLGPVSGTFHGRDIFAPLAGRIAAGQELGSIGLEISTSSLVPPDFPQISLADGKGTVTGRIVSIDHFGNLITDIDMEFLVGKLGSFDRSRVQAWLGDYRLDGLHHHYGEVAANMPVVVTGSRGCLEISVNQGSAAFFFNASTAMPVRVIFPVD